MKGKIIMKRLIFLLIVLFSAVSALAHPTNPNTDIIGIYADTDGIVNHASTDADLELYLVMNNPSGEEGVEAWECTIQWDNTSYYYVTEWDLHGNNVNADIPPSFVVEVFPPLPWTPAINLMTMQVYTTDPSVPCYFKVLPCENWQTIPDWPSYRNGSDPLDYRILYNSTGFENGIPNGNFPLPCCCINSDSCYAISGIIIVDPDPNYLSAPWSLEGPDDFTHSDYGDLSLAHMVAGDYTLIWGEVDGWITPEPNPDIQILPDGGSITFGGTYTEITAQAEIGNWVWWDDNANGLQDPGESGYGAGYVELYNSSEELVTTTWVDGFSGHYFFTNLTPGDYYLRFSGLANDAISPWDMGDDQIDSDMNLELGWTEWITLNTGQIDHSWDCGFHYPTGVDNNGLPGRYLLHQSFPNPFNPITTIRYELPRQSQVTLQIYDISGQVIRVLRNAISEDAGIHEAF